MSKIMFGLVISLIATGCVAGESAYLPFAWSPNEIRGVVVEKAAVLVPIEIKGSKAKLYAQLDTGADLSSFYGPALRAHGIAIDSVRQPELHFRWCDLDGDYVALESPAYVRWDMGSTADPESDNPSAHIVGTIGLDMVVGRILVLDFPNARFAVLDDTMQVESLIDSPVHYSNALQQYHKFYVNVVLGEDTLVGVRYDSGSSSAMLILPLEIWQRATGLTGDEETVARDSVVSWGKYVHILTAPALGDLSLGPVSVANPAVTYVDWPDPTLANTMLMGNAPFADSFIVIVDCMRDKFGVAEPR